MMQLSQYSIFTHTYLKSNISFIYSFIIACDLINRDLAWSELTLINGAQTFKKSDIEEICCYYFTRRIIIFRKGLLHARKPASYPKE